jgi:ribonuclease Z
MPSHRLLKLEIDDLEIIGYSVAGEETVIAIPQLDVCFDIGKAPDQLIPINNVLLSHGHIDHSAGLAYYLSHRQFCGIAPGTVFLPEHLIEPFQSILDSWAKIDGSRIPANLIGVKPGDEYMIKPNLAVKVFPTKHCRGSVGFTVIEKRKKIKPEYASLNGPEIVSLKKQGIAIDNPVEIPIVSYLGDTQYVDFSKLDYVANSKILIAECTFFDTDHDERAAAGKHMHIDQLADLLGNMNNQHVIIVHLTQRTSISDVKKLIKSSLPADICKKITILMDTNKKSPQQ